MKQPLHLVGRVALAFAAPATLAAQEPVQLREPSLDPPSITDEGSEERIPEITIQGTRRLLQTGLDRVEYFDAADIERTGGFTADEVLSRLPSARIGAAQTVLINGRSARLDLSALPAGMIEQIEINRDGGMPDGLPRVSGEVVNLLLKTEYSGADINLRQRRSFAGGGDSGEGAAAAGYKRGDLSTTFMATQTRQGALFAGQRSFSAHQDRTAAGGRDFRLPWGTASAVQATSGFLKGLTDEEGYPVSTALAPLSPSGEELTPGDFIPGPARALSASGLRFFNTADYLYLVAPAQTTSVGAQLTYPFSERVQLHLNYNYARSRADQQSAPPVTTPADGAIVPAALNPFGQDVAIGTVHVGFGPQRQTSVSDQHSLDFAVDGNLGQSWRWNLYALASRSEGADVSRELDIEKFTSALANQDVAVRFNPFIPHSLADYSTLTRLRRDESLSQSGGVGLTASGKLIEAKSGPVMLTVGLAHNVSDTESQTGRDLPTAHGVRSQLRSLQANTALQVPVFNLRDEGPPAIVGLSANLSRDRQQGDAADASSLPADRVTTTLAIDGHVEVPWLTAASGRRGARLLSTRLGFGHTSRSAEEGGRTQNLGLLWAPFDGLQLRARYGRSQMAPTTALYPLIADDHLTFTDPRRDTPIASDVQVVSGTPYGLPAAYGDMQSLSLEFSPARWRGLRLGLDYAVQNQRNQMRMFTAQDVIDNEAALPGRVLRLPQSAADLAVGQPGAISRVDVTPFAGGTSRSRSVDLSVQFPGANTRLGTVNFFVGGHRQLASDNELLPGVPVVSSSDQEAPPEWTFTGQGFWAHDNWRARAAFQYTGSGRYGTRAYDAYLSCDLSLSYQISRLWLWDPGQDAEVGFGIQNLTDAEPPRVDTLTGFRGGSPLGRQFEITLRIPFGR